ncbi:hypothetical protein DAPPUDRAFT_302867 [Daphnia pulex]|uniref:Uncharacterized protein n=1 Tax=Daphnia pulex TaxID=6669 RepID=E9GEY8_DAPPU|nr:hypothetical protein DAPPUDRAFT_302867 [Daphnia pulex]|eukprot:EFX81916.1 hypothetical protein DAPPUDRAFT_302867 [Daphnia pulex]
MAVVASMWFCCTQFELQLLHAVYRAAVIPIVTTGRLLELELMVSWGCLCCCCLVWCTVVLQSFSS